MALGRIHPTARRLVIVTVVARLALDTEAWQEALHSLLMEFVPKGDGADRVSRLSS
jgi:hypothetical protein